MARKSNGFTRLLDNILRAESVYVKGTGIRVLVTDMDYNKGQRTVLVRVKFIDTPTKKVIMKCEQFNIDVREQNCPPTPLGQAPPATHVPSYNVAINSVINVDNLSTTPYETKAAKILYKKK